MNNFLRITVFLICLILSACISMQNTPTATQQAAPPPPATATEITWADEDIALAAQTLEDFFIHLHWGRYEEAENLFGGSYENMIENHPDLDPSDPAVFLEKACWFYRGGQCLKILAAFFQPELSSTNEFVFLVMFKNSDGTLFVRGPCCGARATEYPPDTEFEFTVFKTAEGDFLVMDMPPIIP